MVADNKGRDSEAVSKRYAEHVVAGSFDRADSDKDQRKCSDEFSKAGAEFLHLLMQPNRLACDNVVVAEALWAARTPRSDAVSIVKSIKATGSETRSALSSRVYTRTGRFALETTPA